ncbi:hypothetical protein DFP73DRAFT_100048 [Morchella snyderi]|nr:hypothetical protein DFP73DRAFT_100048 [Morchella snyderi]
MRASAESSRLVFPYSCAVAGLAVCACGFSFASISRRFAAVSSSTPAVCVSTTAAAAGSTAGLFVVVVVTAVFFFLGFSGVSTTAAGAGGSSSGAAGTITSRDRSLRAASALMGAAANVGV